MVVSSRSKSSPSVESSQVRPAVEVSSEGLLRRRTRLELSSISLGGSSEARTSVASEAKISEDVERAETPK